MLEILEKKAVDQSVVTQAADLLLRRGERPTIERVRSAIGRGSPNTINRFLDVWWRQLAGRMQSAESSDGAPAVRPPVPAPLIEACRVLYESIGLEVRQNAEAEAERLRDALEVERRDLLQQAAELSTEREALAAVKSMVELLRSDVVELTASRESVRSELEVARRQANQAQASTDEAQRELERVREQAEGNQRHWLRQIEELRTLLKAAEAKHEAAASKFEKRMVVAAGQVDELASKLISSAAELQHERELRIAAESEAAALRLAIPLPPPAPRRVRPGGRRSRM